MEEIHKHCERIKKYFALASDSTDAEVITWCKITYNTENDYLALLIALDTVIFGREILNK